MNFDVYEHFYRAECLKTTLLMLLYFICEKCTDSFKGTTERWPIRPGQVPKNEKCFWSLSLFCFRKHVAKLFFFIFLNNILHYRPSVSCSSTKNNDRACITITAATATAMIITKIIIIGDRIGFLWSCWSWNKFKIWWCFISRIEDRNWRQ